MEPLATGLASAITRLLEESQSQGFAQAAPPGLENSMGAITGLLRSFIGSLVATQLGQAIGGASLSATGAHDVALPLLEPARPMLMPENIDKWSTDLEIPQTEVYLFHALREAAVARLFAHNPWLVSYIQSAIVEYGRGIHIDIEAIQRQAEEALSHFDPNDMNPNNAENSFTIALNNGIFTPEETPQQRAALSKLETVLALIDGWADEVTTLAAGDRLPALEQLREMYRRQRATNAPSQQLFKSLLGLEVSPKLAREASAFWQKVRQERDIATRDRIWSGSNGSWLIIDEVLGKHEMITYAVAMKPTGEIMGVEIMEYVESYGYEIQDHRWRQQFIGKTRNDPVKLNQDIQNISGATLSAKHVTDGVKRVLAIYDLVLSKE